MASTDLAQPAPFVNARMERFARALAWDIYPLADLLRQQGVTATEYSVWREMAYFQRLVEGHVAQWAAAANTGQRIAVKSGVAVEELLPDIARAIADDKHPLNHRIAAAEFLSKLSGVLNESEKASGAGVSIVFNFGGADTLKVTTEAPVIDAVSVVAAAETAEVEEEDEFGGLNALLLASAAE